MERLKIAYFGSSDFSADLLGKIITDKLVEIKFVVTQPDRPVGRKQILTPTPVKTIALKYKIKTITQLTDSRINELKNINFVLLYAYSGIIPQKLLALPKFGFWCLHPSLLPKYRGTSPMATALINGDKKTGMTIIKMDEEIDHGPIIAQESLTIENNDKRPDLEKKLTELGFQMLKKIISQLTDSRINELKTKEQNHSEATYTKKLKKQDGFIPFENWKLEIGNSPEKIFNLFRGLYPWPGLWTILPNGKRLKITNLTMKESNNLIIESVQLEGKKEVDFKTFNEAYKIY